MGVLRSTVVQFVWPSPDVEALLGSIRNALGGKMGDWENDGGELSGSAGLMVDGLNLANWWKPGMFSALEPIGLTIEEQQLDDGSDALFVRALVPAAGSPLGKGRQGLIQIASMPGATWLPFENTGLMKLKLDLVNPR